MKNAFILVALLCSACTAKIVYRDPPEIPILPKNISEPCPALKNLTGKSTAVVYKEGVNNVYKYADCKSRHASVVKAYEAVRTAHEKYKKEQEMNSKKK